MPPSVPCLRRWRSGTSAAARSVSARPSELGLLRVGLVGRGETQMLDDQHQQLVVDLEQLLDAVQVLGHALLDAGLGDRPIAIAQLLKGDDALQLAQQVPVVDRFHCNLLSSSAPASIMSCRRASALAWL